MGLAAGRDEELSDTFGKVFFRGSPVVANYGYGLGFRGVGEEPVVSQLMDDLAGGVYL